MCKTFFDHGVDATDWKLSDCTDLNSSILPETEGGQKSDTKGVLSLARASSMACFVGTIDRFCLCSLLAGLSFGKTC